MTHGTSLEDQVTDSPTPKDSDRIVTINEFFVTLRGPASLSRKECGALSRQVLEPLRCLVAELRARGLDIDTD
jgi:hypothetical protein